MSELILENQKKLPTNWILTNIETICLDPQYGWTTSASDKGDVKLLRTTDITSGQINWQTVPFCKNNPDDLEKYLVKNGDVVISRAGSIGYSHLINSPPKAVFASYLIRFKPLINNKFFSYFLQSSDYWNVISEKKIGIAVQNVNATKLKQINFPLPPLNEQKRIVAKIEELFSLVDSTKQLLENIKNQLKQYRHSLLNECIEGSFFYGNTTYPKKPISELIDSIGQGWSPRCENHTSFNEEDWAVIKTTAIQPLKFDHEQNKKLPATLEPRNQFELKEGDLLITRAGPRTRVGVACLIKRTRKRLLLCDKAYRIKCKKNLLDPAFLEILLNTPHITKEINKLKTGISDSGVNITQDRFSGLLIPFPPLNEQKRIVVEIEESLSLIEKNEKIVDSLLLQNSSMKNSILKQAFEGKLVPQDPNDEPAEILLQKIKQEKQKTIKETKPRKKKNDK